MTRNHSDCPSMISQCKAECQWLSGGTKELPSTVRLRKQKNEFNVATSGVLKVRFRKIRERLHSENLLSEWESSKQRLHVWNGDIQKKFEL